MNIKDEYHGIIVNISQIDKSVFNSFRIIGQKRVLSGLITLYKVSVLPDDLNDVITKVQNNMRSRILFKKQEFYAHFYRGDELVIVYKYRVFNVTTDQSSWKEAIVYGKSLKIPDKQLDFIPCRFNDESY